MKRLFTLILLIFITNSAFSQLKIKEGSFKKVEGCIVLDKNDHYDSDNMPMALIRIYTEYITRSRRESLLSILISTRSWMSPWQRRAS